MPVEIDAAPVLGWASAAFRWLEQKQMYVWKTEYTIEKLKKARNELEYTIQDVLNTMRDARHNGWSPRHHAEGWVLEGLEITEHADRTMAKFDEQLVLLQDLGSGSTVQVALFYCPCNVLSRRALNFEAVKRLSDVKEHKDQGNMFLTGGFDAVAYLRGPLVLASSAGEGQLLACSAGDGEDQQLVASSDDVDESYESIPKLKLASMAQFRALARSESYESMPVMIKVIAPTHGLRSRAPIDLVMVLDVCSGPDNYERLEQVKQGAMFVVHSLGDEDRLSVIQSAHCLLPLTYMSDQHRSLAEAKIIGQLPVPLVPTDDDVPAMKTAYQILEDRTEHKDRLSCIMHMTDTLEGTLGAEILSGQHPTYAFGIGSDHDPCAMYDLATRGHGTYSFIIGRDSKSIQSAMALCIGGLTSIVARRVNISISAAQPDVSLSGIVSGAHDHIVDEGKTSGSISVDDLCSAEEKNFLVYVKVPALKGFRRTTELLTVKADYYCHVTKDVVTTVSVEVSIKRPIKVRGQTDSNIFGQVASELTRAKVLQGVNKIWNAAGWRHGKHLNMGTISNEVKILQEETEEAGETCKDIWSCISMDLDDMQDTETGLPYMLSWLSSHQWQRAATTTGSGSTTWPSFMTTRMNNMIETVETAPT